MSRHDDNSVTAYSVWELLHIILDVGWLRCLSFLVGSPRPALWISKSTTPTSFFYTRSGRVVTGQKNHNMYDNSTFLRVFVGTVWDIYFLFYRTSNRPLHPSVKDGLKEDLLFFFEKQDYPFPDISQMVDALSEFTYIPPQYWNCDEKEAFVEKFSAQLTD